MERARERERKTQTTPQSTINNTLASPVRHAGLAGWHGWIWLEKCNEAKVHLCVRAAISCPYCVCVCTAGKRDSWRFHCQHFPAAAASSSITGWKISGKIITVERNDEEEHRS